MQRTIIILNDYCHLKDEASRVAVEEAVSLTEAGEKVIFFGANGPICKELQNALVECVCLYHPELAEAAKKPTVLAQVLWNAEAYNEMKALLAKLNTSSTVVHLHSHTQSLTTSPVRVAVDMGFPVVCTLHDFSVACPNGTFFDYARDKPCPKRGMSVGCIATNCDKHYYYHKMYRVMRSGIQKTLGRLPGGVMDYITLTNHPAERLKPYLPDNARYYTAQNLTELRSVYTAILSSRK